MKSSKKTTSSSSKSQGKEQNETGAIAAPVFLLPSPKLAHNDAPLELKPTFSFQVASHPTQHSGGLDAIMPANEKGSVMLMTGGSNALIR